MKTYTRAELESKKLVEIKQIAGGMKLNPIGDLRKSSIWIDAILAAMPKPAKPEEIAPPENEFTLEPVAGTVNFNAYKVRRHGELFGMIFQNKREYPYYWDCGDGRKYTNPKECIDALLSIVPINNSPDGFKRFRVQEEEVFTSGELHGRQLWKNHKDKFYYDNAHDAAAQINPVAMRSQHLNAGGTILLGDTEVTISKISQGHFMGMRSRLIHAENQMLNARFFDLVRIPKNFVPF